MLKISYYLLCGDSHSKTPMPLPIALFQVLRLSMLAEKIIHWMCIKLRFFRDVITTDLCQNTMGTSPRYSERWACRKTSNVRQVYTLINRTPNDPDTMLTAMNTATTMTLQTGEKTLPYMWDQQL